METRVETNTTLRLKLNPMKVPGSMAEITRIYTHTVIKKSRVDLGYEISGRHKFLVEITGISSATKKC
jgi:hypothetical protein